MHPGVVVHSLWELIDSDPAFSFADHHELKAYIQDCWRSRDRKDEQDAVRSLMKKMNIDIMELSGSREKTDFCGVSLYRAQPPRNPKLAPKHYVAGAAGKFSRIRRKNRKKSCGSIAGSSEVTKWYVTVIIVTKVCRQAVQMRHTWHRCFSDTTINHLMLHKVGLPTFYYDCEMSGGINHRRTVKYTQLHYNPDGTIQTIMP